MGFMERYTGEPNQARSWVVGDATKIVPTLAAEMQAISDTKTWIFTFRTFLDYGRRKLGAESEMAAPSPLILTRPCSVYTSCHKV